MSITTPLSKLRVLLVDDEPFIRRVTSDVMKALGIVNVLEAESGVNAIKLLGRNEVDLLISDIQMPEMNGLQLIQKIRMGETKADRGLHTIVVTSFSFTEVLSSCLLLDINGFLVKPITPASVEGKIQFALSEELNLRSAEAYLQVKTDLKVIEAECKKEKRKPNASIVRTGAAVRGELVGRQVPIRQLRPGMELLEDLYATTGIKLLPKGQVLTEVMSHRIIDLEKVINGDGIRVKSA